MISLDPGNLPHARHLRSLALAAGSFLLLLLTCLGGSGAKAAPTATTVIVSLQGSGPVDGAQVFQNCVYIGTTANGGRITLPSANAGDHIFARQLTFVGTTAKGNHDGWAYHVWLTNLIQNNDGSQSDYVIANPALTQNVTLTRTNAQIGFNILASIDYNASPTNIADVAAGLRDASEYLWDVSDGQMFFERIEVRENSDAFDDADIRMYVTVWPNASADGPPSLTAKWGHMNMPGPGFDGNNSRGSYQNPDGFRTIAHEFGHYAIGAKDEYIKYDAAQGAIVDSECTLDQGTVPEASRASIMDSQYTSTEFCGDNNHNADTNQGQERGMSVWAWLVSQYDGAGWDLRTPMTRGQVDPGPTNLPCYLQAAPVVRDSGEPICPTAPHLRATYQGNPVRGATMVTRHNGFGLAQAVTDDNGEVDLYGVNTGDTWSVILRQGTGPRRISFGAGGTILNCNSLIDAQLRIVELPDYYFRPRWRPFDDVLEIAVVVFNDNPPPFAIFVDQDRLGRQQVALDYNSDLPGYDGAFNGLQNIALNFHADLQLAADGLTVLSGHKIQGALYNAAGPVETKADGKLVPRGASPPGWQLFPADSEINVTVNGATMLTGTGVTVADTEALAGTDADLIVVGGPYSVQGTNNILQPGGITIRYQTERLGGLVPATAGIYRFDETTLGWLALTTQVNEAQHMAFAPLSEWGVYAVLAEPNEVPNTPVPTPTFVPTSTPTRAASATTTGVASGSPTRAVSPSPTSCGASFNDVHPTDYFYQPVIYLACRQIISGYADGSFRPYNDTTRAQLAKIVVGAEGWPENTTGGPHFSDVPQTNPFYGFIETAFNHGAISGYTRADQCAPSAAPCFKPFNNVTRGQLSKIVVTARGWALANPSTPTFQDVPTTNAFYKEIETAVQHNIINGYDVPGGREFRWGNNATRGQISKIVYLAVTLP